MRGGGGGDKGGEKDGMGPNNYMYDDSMNIVIHICTCRTVVVHAYVHVRVGIDG